MKNTVYIDNRQTETELPNGARALLRRCVKEAMAVEGITQGVEVSISIVSKDEIAELNSQYRDKPTSTDVLSFPMGEDGKFEQDYETGALILGDVVICMPVAVQQAQEYGHSLERELAFLTVHSLFHLLGYDHETGEEDTRIMRCKEEKALTAMGLTRG